MPVCDKDQSLDNLIRRAKERLRKNIYEESTRDKVLKSSHSFAKYLEKNHKKAVVNAVKKVEEDTNYTQFDDKMYYKICDMLSRGVSVQNPILELMDKNIFENLDHESKQFYLNRLAEKYKLLRTRYYKEHGVM